MRAIIIEGGGPADTEVTIEERERDLVAHGREGGRRVADAAQLRQDGEFHGHIGPVSIDIVWREGEHSLKISC